MFLLIVILYFLNIVFNPVLKYFGIYVYHHHHHYHCYLVTVNIYLKKFFFYVFMNMNEIMFNTKTNFVLMTMKCSHRHVECQTEGVAVLHCDTVDIRCTFSRGSACCRNQPTMAWPASWYATVFFSVGCRTWVFFSRPETTNTQTHTGLRLWGIETDKLINWYLKVSKWLLMK